MGTEEDVVALLTGSPGIDARSLLSALRRTASVVVDKRQLNSVLYAMQRSGELRRAGRTPPRWSLAQIPSEPRQSATEATTRRPKVDAFEPVPAPAMAVAAAAAAVATAPERTRRHATLKVGLLPDALKPVADDLVRSVRDAAVDVEPARVSTPRWRLALADIDAALTDEIRETRERFEDTKVGLHAGKVLGTTERGFTARFELEGDAAAGDGMRVQVGLGGGPSREAEIVGLSGTALSLWVAGSPPADLTSGWMVQDAAFLLQLRQRFVRALASGEAELDALSALAALEAEKVPKPHVSTWTPPSDLGERQVDFVRRALEPGVSWLWGPPGTGKTTTLAHLLGELTRRHLRVLFVSNTNAAVDTAMLKFLETDSPRVVGEVVRLGEPALDRLNSWPTPVTVARVAGERGVDAGRHLVGCRRQISGLRARRRDLDVILREPLTARDRGLIGTSDSDLFDLRTEIETKGLARERDRIEIELGHLADRKQSLEELLRLIRDSVTVGARMVFATVHRTYTAELRDQRFDVAVVDEASMVSADLAMLAAGYSSGHVILAGDFRQLSPIALSDSPAAQRWLRASPFAVSGVARAVTARQPPANLTALDVQHRMRSRIGELIGATFYHEVGLRPGGSISRRPNALPSTVSKAELVLVDTSSLRPWQGKRSGRWSRLNVLHAQTVDVIADSAGVDATVGAIAPFAPQASLLRALVEHRGDRFGAATVHRFQGGERNLIVWDMTEGRAGGASVSKWFDASTTDEEGSRLINVALSRAQDQLIVVADLDRVRAACRETSTLRRALSVIGREGEVVDAFALLECSHSRTRARRGTITGHPLEVALRGADGWLAIWISDPPARVTPELEAIVRGARVGGTHVTIRCGVPSRSAQWDALERLQQLGCSVRLVRPCWENLIYTDATVIASGGSLLDVGTDQVWVETAQAQFAGAVGRLLQRSGERDYASAAPDPVCPLGHPLLIDHAFQRDFRGRCVVCDGDVGVGGAIRSGRRRVKGSASALAGCRSCGQAFDLSGQCGC